MNSYDADELDAFLVEAELINQKVKALAENRMSPEQFDKLEKLRAEDKNRREEAKIRKQKLAYEQKVRGRDGKGITKDFSNFCRFCHKEYQLETPKCLKCNRPTMTLQERQNQLEIMVEDYKKNKQSREQKRHKWQMFQKTQASLWKKSSINYNKKWQYFVEQSQQQQEKQPILPKNDPNFRALQLDMEQRKQKRMKDTEKAKNLKEKGNKAMKQGDYQKASEMYTLSLEHMKDIKSVYTNRALAYIKLKKYKKAVKDCTNVIQYMEVFQKIGQNKDLTFKAFSRRALARKQLKQYKQALEDIVQALKLIPNDKNAELMKKQLENYIQHNKVVNKLITEHQKRQVEQQNQSDQNDKSNSQDIKQESDSEDQKSKQANIVKQIAQAQLKSERQQKIKIELSKRQKQSEQLMNVNPIKQIPKRLQNLNEQNIQYLLKLIVKNDQLSKIFISAKGIEICLSNMINSESTGKQALLICYCFKREGVAQNKVKQWGLKKLFQKIMSKFEDETKLNQSIYQFVANIFEILVSLSLYEPTRLQMARSQFVFDFIDKLYPILITKYKKQTSLLQIFITYCSNISSGESQFKVKYMKKDKFIIYLDSLYLIIFDLKTKNRKYLDLKETAYGFISNLTTFLDHRKTFIEFAQKNNKFEEIKNEIELFPRASHNFNSYIQHILSVLANVSLDSNLQLIQIAEAIFNRFINEWQKESPVIIYRGLLIISRLKYSDNRNLNRWMNVFDRFAQKCDPLANKDQKNMSSIVKILNLLFSFDGPQIPAIPKNLMKALVRFVSDNLVNQNLFCNTCNLFGIIVNKQFQIKRLIFNEIGMSMKRLVYIAKQKTGNWRKSAAILIGKSSVDPECRLKMNEQHGMDVLKSIASFVIDKK